MLFWVTMKAAIVMFVALAAADRAAVVQGIERMFNQGFGQGDTAVVDELCAVGYVEHERKLPGQKPGREGLKQVIRAMHTAFPDLKVELRDLAMEGDKVFVRFAMSGTHTGPYLGRPATGRRFAIEGFDELRFAKGKAIEHWGLDDDLSLRAQLGF